MASYSNQSIDIIDTASFTWVVGNFSDTNNLVWSSVVFTSTSKKIQFQLGIYPNSTMTYCEDDVLVYLWHSETEKNLNLEYDVSILNVNGEKVYTKISPNKQVNLENTEADKDAVLKDYESLLENGKLSDVVLVVGKKEFHVHKLILSARSPVFAAMFEHTETKEAQEGRVIITDVSVEVCEQFLRYIYSGKIDKFKEFSLDLFVVADKYQLKHLKSISEQSLSSNFTTETVVNVLTFADMHNAQELKQKCIDYITKNSVEVRKSDSWKQLCKSKPELVVELYADISEKAKL